MLGSISKYFSLCHHFYKTKPISWFLNVCERVSNENSRKKRSRSQSKQRAVTDVVIQWIETRDGLTASGFDPEFTWKWKVLHSFHVFAWVSSGFSSFFPPTGYSKLLGVNECINVWAWCSMMDQYVHSKEFPAWCPLILGQIPDPPQPWPG